MEQQLPDPEQVSEQDVAAVMAAVDNSFDNPEKIGARVIQPAQYVNDHNSYSPPDGTAKGGELEARAPGVFLSINRKWSFDDTLLVPKWVETIDITADSTLLDTRSQIRIVGGKLTLAQYRDIGDPSESIVADSPTPAALEKASYLLNDIVMPELRKASPSQG